MTAPLFGTIQLNAGKMLVSRLFPWISGPLFFGLFALFLGQDANWDLRNYHLYNPFAYLNNRLGHDMLPAQIANFYNPLLHIPFYWAVMSLPPMLTGFLLGAVQGLNFPILVGIARSVMDEGQNRLTLHSLLAALIGMLGAGAISELGTSFGDNLISLFIFGALWLILANFRIFGDDTIIRIVLIAGAAGILCGMATGLKQPSAIFAVGWCAAFLMIPVPFPRRILLAFCFGIGVLTGIAITGGFWMHELWVHYGNPLFPYFNDFFQSPMAATASYRDTRFIPSGFRDILLMPFLAIVNPYRVGEVYFQDLRFVLFIFMLMATTFFATRKSTVAAEGATPLTRHKGVFLLTAIIISYMVWLKLFAIYRYLLPLEMLLPIAIWLLIDRFPIRSTMKNTAVFMCITVWLITLRPGNWGRVPWGADYFGVTPPVLTDPANTMVIATGVEPMSYLIPFFPAPVRFIRVASYFTGPTDTPNGFDLAMKQAIAGHQGPMFAMFRLCDEEGDKVVLQHYNLEIQTDGCQQMLPSIEGGRSYPILFCPVLSNTPIKNERPPK